MQLCSLASFHKEPPLSRYQLAQINVARIEGAARFPAQGDFVDNLDRINELAEGSPGFVWRLKGDGNDATELRPMGDKIIVNYSIWRDVESLKQFVYGTAHVEILKRKREWFERMTSRIRAVVGAGGSRPDGRGRRRAARVPALARPDAESIHFSSGLRAARCAAARCAVRLRQRVPRRPESESGEDTIMRLPSKIGAIILIVLGTLFLLSNLGLIPQLRPLLSQWWPLILIIVGAFYLRTTIEGEGG